MKVIRPNCRIQFTPEDIAFILRVLQPGVDSPEALARLLADDEARDLILDDDALFQAVLERRGYLRISTHFYFYILVRQVFRRTGIEERAVADYVAELLAEFSRAENLTCRWPGSRLPLDYFVDILAALQTADDTTTFYLRAHLGNRSLFLSGIFPERIRYRRERRGAPDLPYYEKLGQENYRLAGDHRLARKYDLADIFNILSERFQDTRRALNDLGERLVALSDFSFPLSGLPPA